MPEELTISVLVLITFSLGVLLGRVSMMKSSGKIPMPPGRLKPSYPNGSRTGYDVPTPEKYIPVIGFEDRYLVNYFGKIKNKKTNRILKTRVLDNGLERVNLFDGKKPVTLYVHRLVIESWKGFKPMNVKHKDGYKLNNRVDNLEYDKESFFQQPNTSTSLQKPVVDNETGEEYESIRVASICLNMNYNNLSAMLSGKAKNTTTLCLKK